MRTWELRRLFPRINPPRLRNCVTSIRMPAAAAVCATKETCVLCLSSNWKTSIKIRTRCPSGKRTSLVSSLPRLVKNLHKEYETFRFGWLPRIELESRAPQAPVLTVTPQPPLIKQSSYIKKGRPMRLPQPPACQLQSNIYIAPCMLMLSSFIPKPTQRKMAARTR